MDYPNNNDINKKGSKKIIVIALIIIILVTITIVCIKNFSGGFTKKEKYNEENEVASAFFIKNKEGLNALFSKNGKQLTDFIFTTTNEFSNGVSLVKDEKSYSLINEKGKTVINGNSCNNRMHQVGDLYECRSDVYKIFNSKGKKVYEGDYDKLIRLGYYDDLYALVLEDEYRIIDYNGKTIDTIKKVSDDDLDLEYLSSNNYFGGKYKKMGKRNFYEVYYNNKTYIYNIETGKYMNLDGFYKVKSTNSDEKNVTLLKVNNISDDKGEYNIYVNKKLVSTIDSSKCTRGIRFISDGFVCFNSTKSSLYDNKGNMISDNVVYFKNTKEYLTRQKENKQIEDNYTFHNNGKTKTLNLFSVDNREYPYPVVMAKVQLDGEYKYGYNIYDYSGNIINETPFNNISNSYNSIYNNNEVYKASLDNKKVFLYTFKGKKISKDYDSISSTTIVLDGYFLATRDNEKYIIDLNGKEIYSGLTNILQQKDIYLLLKNKNDEQVVYNLKDNKVIYTYKETDGSNISLKDDYFYISNSDTKSEEYYSYETGKKFYSEER